MLILFVVLLAAILPASATQTRTYYIAADEVDWDFAPSHTDLIHGEKYHLQDDPASKGELDPNATHYRKACFHEYTDATFKTAKPRTAAWEHLGVLGPVIRAEVGDTIKVVFKNNASRPYSVHPHGVFYDKSSEGAGYLDGTSGKEKDDDSVAPGVTYTYTWPVPERAGPAEMDGSTAFWVYHSHVEEGRDINSGLIGPMIITRRGMAREDGSPKDVDREFVTDFGMFDEHQSWYWDFNVKRLYGDPKNYDDKNREVHDFHHFFAINGFLDANGPLLVMRKGERVRWYLFTNPNELEGAWDIHSPHWHGQTVTVGHMRMDMVTLNPMMTAVADMVPDNPGTWMFHCHMNGHFDAGMRTLFKVEP
ncbi:MAG TPA: multicopper oxidase domain-containing protein [Terriglobales bacterium]|nr:multicopper oxidase domain-containing protein [Terriglobales bacterium]